MSKPECCMDSCTRRTFGAEDVCLHHFRLRHFFAEPDPEPAHLRPSLSDPKAAWVDYAVEVHGWPRARCDRASKSKLMTDVVKHEQLAAEAAAAAAAAPPVDEPEPAAAGGVVDES